MARKSNLAKIALAAGALPKNHSVKKEPTMDVMTFIESDQGIGMRLYPVQRVILKAHYGVPLDNREKFEVTDWKREKSKWYTEADYLKLLYDEGRCNIREVIPGHERREMVLSLGRRSGKSTLTGCIQAYETYRLIQKGNPLAYYGLAPSNRIQLISVASGRDQAGILYNEVSSHFGKCQFFKRFQANNTQSFTAFQTPHDIENFGSFADNPKVKASIRVTFASSNAKGLRGWGNIVIIMDEVAHFVTEGGQSAEAVYDAISPSAAAFTAKDEEGKPLYGADTPSEARIIMISSPLGRQGLFYKMFQIGLSGQGAAENMLCVQAPTWEVNPTISANVFKQRYAVDPIVFLSEFGAQFSDRTLGWLEDPQDLLACIKRENRPRVFGVPGRQHFVGIDVGLVNDATAVAIVHLDEEGKIVLDYIDQMQAKVGKFVEKERLEFDDVAAWILELSRKFNITEGMFDQHLGIPLEQALLKKGLSQFKAHNMTPVLNSQIYSNFKSLIWDKKVVLYDYNEAERAALIAKNEKANHMPYLVQLMELQANIKSKYIVEVEAPRGEGKHDDYADALARAVWLASQKMGMLKHIARSKPIIPGMPKPTRMTAGQRLKLMRGGSSPERQVIRSGPMKFR